MEISKCMGCMEAFRGYPCPNCGYEPGKQKGQEFFLPVETILNGKYLVGRVLGQGGFGITYIGWDIGLERKVAIKEYYPSGQVSRAPGSRNLTWYTSDSALSARRDGMEMFLKEARKMAKLDNIPNVVRIRDLFQENDTAYIVMDFVEGRTLKSLLKENGPMRWEQAKPLFQSTIRAMERVHRSGLVHRDLSPDNLMITKNGEARILDLGAAKDLSINSGASSMQVAKGGFSPLEQYTQRGGSGTWTDVYAMAATIYYTLTGKLPPTAVDRVTEDTIRWDDPGLTDLPVPVLETLKKAMAVKAGDRIQTMQELEMGLFSGNAAPGPGPKPNPNPNPGKKLPKWLIPGAAALALVCGLGYWAMVIKPAGEYKAAQALADDGQYSEAEEAFAALGDYQDSAEKAEQARQDAKLMPLYQDAQTLMDDGKYLQAMRAFSELDYRDSAQKVQEAKEAYWETQRASLAAGCYHTVALQSNGTVTATGKNDYNQCIVSGWTDIQAVDAGFTFTMGLRSDGTVVATGFKDKTVSGWTDIVAIAAGEHHLVGLRSDGTVVAGGGLSEEACDVGSWTDIVAVSAGYNYTMGLRSDGTVVAVGDASNSQCDVSGWRDIVAVSAGYNYAVGLRSDGTVITTGRNNFGQCDVSGWTDIVAVEACYGHTVGLRSDGTVVSTGWNKSGQCRVERWSDLREVTGGWHHSVGLLSDGTAVAIGLNDEGECDVGSWQNIRVSE